MSKKLWLSVVGFVCLGAAALPLFAGPKEVCTDPSGIERYVACDASGNVQVDIVSGAATGYAEDTAIAAGEAVTMAGVVRQNTLASLVSETGERTELQVNELGRAYTNAAPIYDADTKTDCVAIPVTTETDHTLSTVSDSFMVCAEGNTAYVACADSAPEVTTAAAGFSFFVSSGQCRLMNIKEAICAVEGTASAGFICFSPVK